jgi:PAS domain-containing protein
LGSPSHGSLQREVPRCVAGWHNPLALRKGQVFRESRGDPIRMIGLNIDIDERKCAEAALRESEEHFPEYGGQRRILLIPAETVFRYQLSPRAL